MDFSFTEDQQTIRDAVLAHCARFPDDYWLERDNDGVFPHDFHRSMAEAGWLGLAMPESVGGAGLGMTEAAIMMQAVAESGGGIAAASSIHGPVFSIEVREIRKMGRHAVDSNLVFISDLWVPEQDRIGAEGDGFTIILHGLNPERILLGAEAIGLGRVAISKAARYARERIVFDRPIGMNQGIQHPLAKCWAQLEAANLMIMKAATRFDQGLDCGVEANAGKYLAAEAGFEACHTAMLTLGGMGYAQEYHVERYLREVLIPRTAPVSPHMILNFLAEKVLGLPKSY